MPSNRILRAAPVVLLAVGAIAASTHASVSDPALIVRADNGIGVDIFSIPLASLAAGGPAGSLVYTLPSPMTLPNTGTIVQQLNLIYVPENAVPAQENLIGLNYTLWTGDQTTTFTVSSGVFTLPGVPAQYARGSAGVSITNGHQNIPADGGATYTGLQGAAGFLTQVDGGFGAAPAYLPGGTLFDTFGPANLFTTTSTFGTDFTDYTFLGTNRTSMSSQWRFSLTGGDQVAVVSSFFSSSIIPGPGGAAVLAFSGLALARRRR